MVTVINLVADFDRFSIVFEIYPAFGSLILAKQIVLYEQIRNTIENNCFAKHSGHLTVPLLDKNLESVGKLSFACSLVTPFQHPAMKIGGSVDTYWKSPRIYPTLANGDQKKMITSLSTEYIVAQVVMTGDGHIVTLQTTTDQWPMLFKMTLDEIKLSNSSVISLEDMLMVFLLNSGCDQVCWSVFETIVSLQVARDTFWTFTA
jgi:hypothetical protein